MRLLFLFLDGLGLGPADPETNPLARAQMPVLQELLEGGRLLAEAAPFDGKHASLVALDAVLGVSGLPQSATGQTALLTGKNAPALVGEHYGPKPNRAVARVIKEGTLFSTLRAAGKNAALLNAYPPRYFHGIASGHRLLSAIPLAVTRAGIDLKTEVDYFAGQALSADFTGLGWREHLGIENAPIYPAEQAGERLAALAKDLHLAFFEYWLTDYAGHRRDWSAALEILETIDRVLGGLVQAWDGEEGLILLTSDHGNLEDLSTRRHTANNVPALVIGARNLRQAFTHQLQDLTGVAPAVLRLINSVQNT